MLFHPYLPQFRAEVLLNFVHANEASKEGWHRDKIVIYGPPYMNMVNKQKDMRMHRGLFASLFE